MKNVIKNLQKRLLFVAMICLASLTITNCEAKSAKISEKPYAAVDSLMRAELGDSIADIILNAKQVKAERINVSLDTIKIEETKKLRPELVGALKYVFATSDIHAGNAIAYHHFSPSVRLTFSTKKETCIVLLELGSKQMQIKDIEDNTLKTCGYSKDDFIKICNVVFTKDEFLTFLLNQE